MEAKAAVEAGAGAIHIHICDRDGQESLNPDDIARSLEAIRSSCPDVPIGISTGAWIVPDLKKRLSLIKSWEKPPDFASVNMYEEGAVQVAKLLLDRGVGVEAGICNGQDVEIFVRSDIANKCLRVLIELAEENMPAALTTLELIEAVLNRVKLKLPRLLHGENVTAWELVKVAVARGYDTRIGFEDVLTLPDGTYADGNASLIAAACQIAAVA
jgi:uncharacterized protein (DUF849 family)